MVVLGHSGATAWNSDPAKAGKDAPENSWATGDNPAVNSIYLRALAENPALERHNFNVARSGSDVTDLPRQVELALAREPLPDLFIIQSVDNDIQCDGTDTENYQPYGEKMTTVLTSINGAAPSAQIFVVGTWATVDHYTDVTQRIPVAVSLNQGGGLCDVFDQSGNQLPDAVAYFRDVNDHYLEQLRSSCAAVRNCRFGGDAILNMTIVADDLADDTFHLSIQGQAKMAGVAWTALNG